MIEAEYEDEWELSPFEDVFLHRREQLDRLVGVTGAALRSMEGATRLSQSLKKSTEHVDSIRSLEEAALAEVAADMPLIHGSASVLLWGALEASVRDFIVRWLIRYPQARLSPELRSLKVRFVEYEALAPDDRMRYLVGVLERELGAALKPGTGRFECLLSPFGLGTSLEPEHRRTLSELAAVRNVIVHRAGIADERLLELCPWLEVKVGDQVNVTRAQFIGFRKAASEYVVAIIAAAKAALAKSKADSAA